MDGSDLEYWKIYDAKKKTILPFEAIMDGNFEETDGNSHACAPPDVAEAICRPIDDCTVHPYSSMGVIISQLKNDNIYFICSACIIGERKVMTVAHAFDDCKPQNSTFVPQAYNVNCLKDERNQYGHFTIDAKTLKLHPKYKPTTFKEIIHEKMGFSSGVKTAYDICTAEVNSGSKFSNFEEAGLKPIQLRHLDLSFDSTAKNMILGYVKEDKTVTMCAVEGTILPDLGNSRLIMNKRANLGMSGGPWLIGSSAVGVQSSINNRSSYSPYFEPQLFNVVDSDLQV